MTDLGSVLEAVNLVKGIGDVGKMIGNDKTPLPAKKRKKAGEPAPEWLGEFSDLYDQGSPRGQAISSRAPGCYAHAMDFMEELGHLQEKVAYSARLKQSMALKIVEKAKELLANATSHGVLAAFNKLVPETVPALEVLVKSEIEVMSSMQRQVGYAVHHSTGIVNKMEAYDTELLNEFDKAKKEFSSLERKLQRTQASIAEVSEKQGHTGMDDPAYVEQQLSLNSLRRTDKETRNRLEVVGQQVVDTYKQSSQVRAKEDVVRAGLHELRLVNAYVTRFLGFQQHMSEPDELLPQLVQTAQAVTNSYQVLTSIVVTGSAGTTAAVETLVDVIGKVDYRVLPNVQKEVNKQKATLERADKRTSFYEQAVKLLRGDYSPGQQPATPSQTPAQSAG